MEEYKINNKKDSHLQIEHNREIRQITHYCSSAKWLSAQLSARIPLLKQNVVWLVFCSFPGKTNVCHHFLLRLVVYKAFQFFTMNIYTFPNPDTEWGCAFGEAVFVNMQKCQSVFCITVDCCLPFKTLATQASIFCIMNISKQIADTCGDMCRGTHFMRRVVQWEDSNSTSSLVCLTHQSFKGKFHHGPGTSLRHYYLHSRHSVAR